MAKTQGKVISEGIKEAKKGMQIVYEVGENYFLGKIDGEPHNAVCRVEKMDGNCFSCPTKLLKRLVVMQYEQGHINKPSNGTFDVTPANITYLPLKFSQWQAAIENGEVDSNKFVNFETIEYPFVRTSFETEEMFEDRKKNAPPIMIAKIIPAKKKFYDEDEVIALLVKERNRAVDVAYYFRDKHLASFESKKKAGSQVAFVEESIAEECRYIGNAISGLNGLSAALGETVETIVAKEFKKQSNEEAAK